MDLDDFIRPGQSCIKPVEVPKQRAPKVRSPPVLPQTHSSRIQIAKLQIGADGEMSEVYEDGQVSGKLERVEVSLADCLACRFG